MLTNLVLFQGGRMIAPLADTLSTYHSLDDTLRFPTPFPPLITQN